MHIYNPAKWLDSKIVIPHLLLLPGKQPEKRKLPAYMAPDGENFRGINAVRVLGQEKSYTIDKVIATGYDTYLAAFEVLIPAL